MPNGRELASAVQDVEFKQARQEFRATGTAADPKKDVQVSGRAIGR
ncbi:hypothetical protein AA11826_1254 [Komagataeibacter oboediens DSM 11826]|nr:hypothetical protein AA11826_1254 [Komagataeibacter oboediens DSM 11826]